MVSGRKATMAERSAQVRMDWGLRGAEANCAGAGLAVVVDVLSFTTTLSVAMDIGAEVYPYEWQDESAREFAARRGAVLAVGRYEARRGDVPGPAISLSPASLRQAVDLSTVDLNTGDPSTVDLSTGGLARIVLPSPNGSALARVLGGRDVPVVGAALRNRAAVARWIARELPGRPGHLAVIAAGERWSDGSLRPAVEDLWGVGSVITALAEIADCSLSPEAATAVAAFSAVAASLPADLAASVSGQELIRAGYPEDVAIAAELDTSPTVPVLYCERFVNAG
jgi:2-phosphosulfolactate phosphatase